MEKITFNKAREKGELLNKGGYHQPGSNQYMANCNCQLTTDKGAYKDMSFRMPDNTVVHFYHQSPVAIEKDGKIRLDNCGWKTNSTKERINRYSPIRVFQEDFDWYVKIDGEKVEFKTVWS